jgi:hypothetical protein
VKPTEKLNYIKLSIIGCSITPETSCWQVYVAACGKA